MPPPSGDPAEAAAPAVRLQRSGLDAPRRPAPAGAERPGVRVDRQERHHPHPQPASARAERPGVRVVIPMKPLALAKSRLGGPALPAGASPDAAEQRPNGLPLRAPRSERLPANHPGGAQPLLAPPGPRHVRGAELPWGDVVAQRLLAPAGAEQSAAGRSRPLPPPIALPGTGLSAPDPVEPVGAPSVAAPPLAPTERAALALWLLRRVVLAARAAPGVDKVVVLGGDGAVRAAACELEVAWEADEIGELNAALDAALAGAVRDGCRALLFLPGDLPWLQPAEVGRLTAGALGLGGLPPLRLAPGVRGGTNALLVPCGAPFRFELGPDSFARHLAQARRLGLAAEIVRAPGLAQDIDLPADLALLVEHGPRPLPWADPAAGG